MIWLGFADSGPDHILGDVHGHCLPHRYGGGDFSSFMPSTSIFFPKTAGSRHGDSGRPRNFGVSIVQFVTPWIIGFAALGAIAGGPQNFVKADVLKDIAVTKNAGGVVTNVVAKRPDLAAATVITREAM